MYEYLRGAPRGRTAARIVLDVGGVGYDLQIPPGLSFPSEDPLTVWTHHYVREEIAALYGFPDRDTRDLFRLLLSVRGVGPQMALGVLAGLPRQELLEAVLAEDIKPLTRVKGVGKKTAEQILLDLRDKAARIAGTDDLPPVDVPRPGALRNQALEDAIAALVSVGYSEKEGRTRVERAADSVDIHDLELLVRTALRP